MLFVQLWKLLQLKVLIKNCLKVNVIIVSNYNFWQLQKINIKHWLCLSKQDWVKNVFGNAIKLTGVSGADILIKYFLLKKKQIF